MLKMNIKNTAILYLLILTSNSFKRFSSPYWSVSFSFWYCSLKSLAATSVSPHSMASRMASWMKIYWGWNRREREVI